MTKKYTTTVTTEWEIRGEVTPEMINARIKAALSIGMMTKGNCSYAFFGSDNLLEVSTVEGLGEFDMVACYCCGAVVKGLDAYVVDMDDDPKIPEHVCERCFEQGLFHKKEGN